MRGRNSKYKDLSGQKFGKLLVLERGESYKNSAGVHRFKWKCLCDCGNITYLSSLAVTKTTKSCGCYIKERLRSTRHDPQMNGWNNYFRVYKSGAKSRGYCWDIEQPYFINVCSMPCTYCGVAPSKNEVGKKNYIAARINCGKEPDYEFAEAKIILSNGLDRVDNSKGYVAENVVSCCSVCNYKKAGDTEEEWKAWIDRLVAHQIKKKD